MPPKILVLRPRFLGDLILTTGLPGLLKKARPGAQVWFLAESAYAEVLQAHPQVDGVLEFDGKRKNNFFYHLGFLKKIRDEKFDVVLDLFGNPRTAQMAFFSGAAKRVGFDLGGRRWAYNILAAPSSDLLPSGRRKVTEAYLDQVRALGISPEGNYATSLFVTEEEKTHAHKILERAKMKPGEKLAVLSPGASWPAKQWPLDRFLELAGILKSQGVRPLFILGPKESDLAVELENKMEKDWLFINQPSLRGLLAFVAAADILIANDSGPVHVGPAVGTPTIGIFGPGEPEVWFPYGAPHETAYLEVPCGHCGLDQCPLMACMRGLTVESVAQKTFRMLGFSSK